MISIRICSLSRSCVSVGMQRLVENVWSLFPEYKKNTLPFYGRVAGLKPNSQASMHGIVILIKVNDMAEILDLN